MGETPPFAIVITAYADDQLASDLKNLLETRDIPVTIVDSTDSATAAIMMADSQGVFFILVDARDMDPDTVAATLAKLEQAKTSVPRIAVIPFTDRPTQRLVVRALRAGADDFFDVTTETEKTISAALSRVSQRLIHRATQKKYASELRDMVEELLRDLIRTERRSIDLEQRLRAVGSSDSDDPDIDMERAPALVIIEDDEDVLSFLVEKLEAAGLTTYAFLDAETALREVRQMTARREPYDLALIDIKLPGMSGLDALNQLRELRADLAAIFMTGYSDIQTATVAADSGIIGYVLKPFDDVAGLVQRLEDHARQTMNITRDQKYLARIKKRHEGVLRRYRELTNEASSPS